MARNQGRPQQRPGQGRGNQGRDTSGFGGGRSGARGRQQGRSQGGYKGQGKPQGQGGRAAGRGRSFDQGRGGSRPRPRPGSERRSDLIEGRRAVEEALSVGLPLKSALVQIQSIDGDPMLERLAKRLETEGVTVERVPRARLDAISSHGAHQGIVVRTKPFEYAELADIIRAAGKDDALVLVLDHVTDEGNFGAIVRTAEVVGAAGVVIAKARAASVGVGAYKTSAGAVMHIPIAQVSNLARAVDELKDAGFWACASTEHATQSVWEAPLSGRVALVMGSEGDGISRLVLEKCDFSCKLPQRGRVESLNVAQATTVMCYEWLRREMTGGAADGQ